ncbi:MAG: RNA 2',3'-cyclic phosphodiesterase [Acidobacteriota bacterium]
MAEEIRTFIAVELQEEQKRALRQVQETLRAERAGRYVRWVAPEAVHLTLKFLGGVDADKMPGLQSALTRACADVPPFTLTLRGVGAFPNTRRPNVVWVGVGGEIGTITRLAEQIDGACASLGFSPETRPFSPHLTIGRVKRDVRPVDQQFVGEMVANNAVGELGECRVEHVSIMKSDLRPTGSEYTRLYVIDLMRNK